MSPAKASCGASGLVILQENALMNYGLSGHIASECTSKALMLELSRIRPHGDQLSKRGHLSFTRQGHIGANCTNGMASKNCRRTGRYFGEQYDAILATCRYHHDIQQHLSSCLGSILLYTATSQASKLETEEYSSEGSFGW
ncbi:hypothetical protein RHGRI_016002 [Rhododendron griersonianum]|uniref:Uncharacterized protein n=1 Tax=Rhododendron griersonianum TaxID=479676 RepID=A0AAV6JPD6_9ERIC|nr:hypothetical protein RHGRI_016002 [Rhododendron griersonianum]